MSDEVAQIIAQRNTIIDRLDRIVSFVEASQDVEACEVRCAELECIKTEFNNVQAKLIRISIDQDNDDDEEPDDVGIQGSEQMFDDLYFRTKTAFKKLNIANGNNRAIVAPTNPGCAQPGNAVQPFYMNTLTREALPKINIPKFGGDIHEWPKFISLFDAVVHKAAVPAMFKYHHLRSALQGDALNVISNIPLTEANYEAAYNALQARYQNTRLLATYYLNKLFAYKPVILNNRDSLQNYISTHRHAVEALKTLQIPNESDFILFYMAYKALDKTTQTDFDKKQDPLQIPSYEDLIKFVTNKLQYAELNVNTVSVTAGSDVRSQQSNIKTKPAMAARHTFLAKATSEPNCPLCKGSYHYLVKCSKFIEMSVQQRYDYVRKHNRCINCLGNHFRAQCKSDSRCKQCSGLHHSCLHFDKRTEEESQFPQEPPVAATAVVLAAHPQSADTSHQVLLGTAIVNVQDSSSHPQLVRAVLDSGSQVTIVTKDCIRRLGLRMNRTANKIAGISNEETPILGAVKFEVQSRNASFRMFVEALVMEDLPQILPTAPISVEIARKFERLQLADPHFSTPGKIDMILGAGEYCEVMSTNRATIYGKPSAVSTALGWVIMGRIESVKPPVHYSLFTASLDDTLKRFWEIEEITVPHVSNPEDDFCERQFVETHRRLKDGRYEVALPFKPHAAPLGSNRKYAEESFRRFENRLIKSPEVYEKYRASMQDYLDTAKITKASSPAKYVIPQHVVCKSSTTTSVRTVMNASTKSSTGASLNDLLFQGPKLQQDLSEVLTGFRLNPVAVSADIKQMYLQIRVREPDCDMQRVFWRYLPTQPLEEYVCRTVVFGVNCSPFLALRVVQQLVKDEGDQYPLAAAALQQGTYMDNITACCKTIDEARELCQQLKGLLESGCLPPRKWASSHEEVLKDIPVEHRDTPLVIREHGDDAFKVLGLEWSPTSDTFAYTITEFDDPHVTKRTCLSYIARLYDPLGLLAPYVFLCKSFLQLLWLTGSGWDDPLDQEHCTEWDRITQHVKLLQSIQVPRHVPVSSAKALQLLGFCDASNKGYCCVIYLRCELGEQTAVCLIRAKSKVSPLKTMSIPRLELSAALLLSRLFVSIASIRERLPAHDVYLFTDSTIVLGWLRTPPHLLKTFVSHRVVEILDSTTPSSWHHVASELNPADCGSRGLIPSELIDHPLWWTGPAELQQPLQQFLEPTTDLPPDLPEVKSPPPLVMTTAIKESSLVADFEKFSTLRKLNRTYAYVYRFINNCRNRAKHVIGPLSTEELNDSMSAIVLLQQQHSFNEDYRNLQKNTPVNSSISKLTPFLDKRGLLRVGGRLGASHLKLESKHPLLLPAKCYLAILICRHYHAMAGHAGPQATQAFIQRNYWIMSVRSLIRKVTFNCVLCTRLRAKVLQPIMGQLPEERVTPSRAFTYCSTDFGGPFPVKESRRRNAATSKGYLCVFVCGSTKAVHLEFLSSLTMEAYLAALDRMCARRGLPNLIRSDQGRTYIGASRHLTEVAQFLQENKDNIFSACATRSIRFQHTPPFAPHFGGLHEAGIRSAKNLLKRLIGNTPLVFEEYTTLFSRIEAILNSRPLYEVPTSTEDSFDYLSPGHFLIGAPLVSPPEPIIDANVNLVCRWQRIRQTAQGFWKRWSQQYLHTQIQRKKWHRAQENIRLDQMVLVADMNSAPLAWPLGRVVALHPGSDGVVRVVDVRTQTGIYRRAVHKLVVLPTAGN